MVTKREECQEGLVLELGGPVGRIDPSATEASRWHRVIGERRRERVSG
jgi:hypothetical protein